MVKSKTKRYIILSILFFLPVIFLLFLYPAQHNYIPLDIVKENIPELTVESSIRLEDHITVLAFLGKKPQEKAIALANLKELVYDKFKGFKKFQVVIIVHPMNHVEASHFKELKKEINQYQELKYWHYLTVLKSDAKEMYSYFNTMKPLDENLSSDEVFIIDQDLNQRGRLDDRTDNEIEKNKPVYGLYSYNCIEVATLKNKMSEDMRILFTEYRQKRKGNFDSSTRRASDLKQ